MLFRSLPLTAVTVLNASPSQMGFLMAAEIAPFVLLSLPAGDQLNDPNYRRIFASVVVTHFGAQITMLALPLTAVTVLNASPSQMGFLMAAEIAPFVLLSLPAGVWLDRMRKLPVYVIGEMVFAAALMTVPLAAWTGYLSMTWLYAVGVVLGCVHEIGRAHV